MYVPRAFAPPDDDAVTALLDAHPLAVVVYTAPDGLVADHLPLLHDPAAGVLRGHVARANPLWRHADGAQVLAIFRGPDAYVTPSWYPSKAAHGEVVPTWNYLAAHARGTLRAVTDRAWLLRVVSDLTARQERDRAAPWAVTDAPADYVDRLLGALVGVEIRIDALTGKWKASQNRDAEDRAGVAAGLADHPLARAVRG